MSSSPVPTSRRSRWLAVPVLVGLMAAGLVASAAPAAAAVPGIQRVVATSASNVASPKSITATCPVGKRLIGTGAEVNGGLTHHLVIDDVTPNPGLTAVTATAYNDEYGFFSAFSVTAYAVCANPLAGLTLVTAASASNSIGPKSATATCPATYHVVGTGADITGGGGQVILDQVTPNAGLTTVSAAAYEDPTGTAANWFVRAYAICARPLPGIQRVTAASALDLASPKTVTVNCPGGKVTTSAGIDIAFGNGTVFPGYFRPNAGLGSVSARAEASHSGAAGNWRVTAYAICATA